MRLRNLFTLLAVLAVVAACDDSGRFTSADVIGDLAQPADTVGIDTTAPDGGAEDIAAPPIGPAFAELMPLSLADYGPAFWMEGVVVGDGLLEVTVKARDLTSMVGFAAQVTWDPDLMELVEAAATAPVGGPDAEARGVAAGLGAGRLTLGVARFPKEVDPWNPTPLGVDLPGTVEMGTFVLRPLAPGDAVLRFREGHRVARRPDYGAISCAWAGLQVRITGEALASGEGSK